MVRFAVIVFAAGLALLWGCNQRELAWSDSFESTLQKAAANKTIILVDFYADW